MARWLVLLLVGCNEYNLSKALPAETGDVPDSGAPDSGEPAEPDAPSWADPSHDEQLDQWDLSDVAGADLLFFGDTSGSMAVELTTMGDEISGLLSTLSTYTESWQLLAVTGPTGCGVNGVLTPETPDYATLFASGLLTPPGEDLVDEWGLYNADAAVQATDEGECNAGFMREGARLHVVFVSDEDDNSPGFDSGDTNYWTTYVNSIIAKKGSIDDVRFSAIVGPTPDGCDGAEPGTGYTEAVLATGGALISICEDWASQLDTLVDVSVDHTTFSLSKFPVPRSITVMVNGSDRAEGWIYDMGLNAVIFSVAPPATGDQVAIYYNVRG